jgi:predicted metal-dependent hydrolase
LDVYRYKPITLSNELSDLYAGLEAEYRKKLHTNRRTLSQPTEYEYQDEYQDEHQDKYRDEYKDEYQDNYEEENMDDYPDEYQNSIDNEQIVDQT